MTYHLSEGEQNNEGKIDISGLKISSAGPRTRTHLVKMQRPSETEVISDTEKQK